MQTPHTHSVSPLPVPKLMSIVQEITQPSCQHILDLTYSNHACGSTVCRSASLLCLPVVQSTAELTLERTRWRHTSLNKGVMRRVGFILHRTRVTTPHTSVLTRQKREVCDHDQSNASVRWMLTPLPKPLSIVQSSTGCGPPMSPGFTR